MTLKDRDLRGSRLRCLMLTAMPQQQIASILTELIKPIGVVDANCDRWAPRGFVKPDEAKLGEHNDFLSPEQREVVTGWWLTVRRNANTPNWDLVSSCNIGAERGLLLVEAKAHTEELKRAGKEQNNVENDCQIGNAICEANFALNNILPGWGLTKDSHYQLCNRFAWTWKLAEMGIPVVLVYLGFLHCDEMRDCGIPFNSGEHWKQKLMEHSETLVPQEVWHCPIQTSRAPIWALARSMELQWKVSGDVACE